MRHRVHISYSKDEAHAKYHLELALLPSIFNIQIFFVKNVNEIESLRIIKKNSVVQK